MQRVLIVGLGLIGGSIGLALRRWSEEHKQDGRKPLEVSGFDPNLDHQRAAEKMGAVDRGVWDLAKAAREADVVVVATPVAAMRDVFKDIAPQLRPGVVVTDTASTKANVLAWAAELLPPTVDFVGGHPMAGKTQSIEGAEASPFLRRHLVCRAVRARLRRRRTHGPRAHRRGWRGAIFHQPARARRVRGRREPFAVCPQRGADEHRRVRPIVARHEDPDRWWLPGHHSARRG